MNKMIIDGVEVKTNYTWKSKSYPGGGHMVCIKKTDGKWKLWDTWNSTGGCIGNYWSMV